MSTIPGKLFDSTSKMIRCLMRINHRCFNLGVPHELLNRGEINPAHQETACKGMTERMNLSQSLNACQKGRLQQGCSQKLHISKYKINISGQVLRANS